MMRVRSNEAVMRHGKLDFLRRRIGLRAAGDGGVGGGCGITVERVGMINGKMSVTDDRVRVTDIGVADRIWPSGITWHVMMYLSMAGVSKERKISKGAYTVMPGDGAVARDQYVSIVVKMVWMLQQRRKMTAERKSE